jgi:hypothetical protein
MKPLAGFPPIKLELEKVKVSNVIQKSFSTLEDSSNENMISIYDIFDKK